MNTQPGVDGPSNPISARVLAAGDLLALLAFVILGRIVHAGSGPVGLLENIPRIAAPFLLGWVIAAPVFGAYRRTSDLSTGRFLLNSALTLLAADLIAFVVRGYLLSDAVTLPFVLTALAVTGLLVIGWRILFACVLIPNAARSAQLQGAGRD